MYSRRWVTHVIALMWYASGVAGGIALFGDGAWIASYIALSVVVAGAVLLMWDARKVLRRLKAQADKWLEDM